MGNRHKRIFSLSLMAVLLLCTLAPAAAQDPSLPDGDTVELDEPVVVRLYVQDRAHLDAVAGRLDIWEVHPEEGYVLAALQPQAYRWLQDLGYQVEIDTHQTAQLGIQAPLDSRFYYYDDYYFNLQGRYVVDFLQDIHASYPSLTQLYDIGDAWLAGQAGEYDRNIWVLRISNEDAAFGAIQNKPAFFLFATVHAREVATPELAIRYIKYLTEGYDGEGGYGVDPDVTWLVDHHVVYVLVMQNPDGHVVNEQDTAAYRRKNLDWDDGCNDPDLWGVDMNRNHSFLWGCCEGSSGEPCAETYRGPSPGSEPETQAFQNYFATVMLDQNGPNGDDEVPPAAPITTTGIFVSLHSYSDVVLWPWYLPGYPPAPNADELAVIGRKLAALNGYGPSGNIGYTVDGATDYWTYGKFGLPSFTFEVGPGGVGVCNGFFPAYGCIDGIDGMPRNFWAENKPAFLYAHKIARTPYITAYGPDTEDVTATPVVAAQGTPVSLSAIIADHRYPGDEIQPIAAAEYFVDAPGEDGTGTLMTPSDGAWGDLGEVAEGVVDTSGLAFGRHYLLVHGQNDDGAWGPLSAVFFWVLEPGVAPTIEGYVRDGTDNTPVAATVAADWIETQTDPATGYYHMTVFSGTYDVSAIAPGYAISTVTGVQAFDYQAIQQSFFLSPFCDIFVDDVEAGNLGWTAEGNWAITDEASHSPSHAWTDSPGASYGANWNYALISPILDLSGFSGTTLGFWHVYDLEEDYDFGYVEYSIDGRTTWAELASYNGEDQTTWMREEFSLLDLDGQSKVRIRFRLETDWYGVGDGWHVDDIELVGGGQACIVPLAPEAGFASNSPVYLGSPVVFANLTKGTPLFEYLWDFGDGGTSTESDPQHLYVAAGIYTVTLAATNTLGSDAFAGPVAVVEPGDCISLTRITIAGLDSGYPGTYTFTTDYAPSYAMPPINYAWENGDAGDTSVRSLSAGAHTLVVTATNCASAVVTDTHVIVVEPLELLHRVYLPIVLRSDGN